VAYAVHLFKAFYQQFSELDAKVKTDS